MSKYFIKFRNKTNEIKNTEIENFKSICQVFKDRVVEYDSNLFYVDSIDITDNCVRCMKLYDKNGIKVNLDYYKKKGLFMKFFFKDLNHNFKILSLVESDKLLQEYEKSQNIIKVFYVLEPGNTIETEGCVYLKSYGKKLTIVKISPEALSITDYNIDNSANMIMDVKHKNENLKVIYQIEEIKEEIQTLPASLQIYFSIFKKTINIIHVHYLNPEIALHKGFDAFHLEKNEDPNLYKIYNEGYINRTRILFKNYKVIAIYYLSQQEDGKETTIALKSDDTICKLERIYKIKCDSYFNNFYCKIKKVPVYQLALIKSVDFTQTDENDYTLHNEKVESCKFSTEDLHDSIGFIDVEIIFDSNENYLYDTINVSIPVCKLVLVPISKETELEKISLSENKKRKSDEILTLDKIYRDVTQKFEHYLNNKDSIVSLSIEQLKHAITVLEKYKSILPNIGKYVERNELWQYLEVKIG